MATRTDNTFKKADGFINMQLADKAGVKHQFRVGIPLHADRKLDAAILNNPSLLVTALQEGRVTISVHVIAADDDKPLDL